MALQGYKVESIRNRSLQMCDTKATADNLMDEFFRRIQKALHEPRRRFIN